MSKRPADHPEEASSAQKVKINHVDGDEQYDERYTTLWTHLAMRLFEDRPARHEVQAVQYIANMYLSPSPTPTVEGYLHYISETYPSAPQAGVARSWNKLKEYFSSVENANMADIQDLIDVQSLIAAFSAAPKMLETPQASTSMAPPPCPVDAPAVRSSPSQPPTKLARSNGSKTRSSNSTSPNSSNNSSPSISSNSNSNSTSNSTSNSSRRSSASSGGQLSSATVLKMRTLFRKNFNDFDGEAWKLPSGATLDNLLASHIEHLPYESALHSFVIEDVKGVLQLATDERDRALLKETLMDRPNERLPTLSAPEKAFLMKYNLPPDDLRRLLATSGWRTIGSGLKEQPDEEFQELVHTCIFDLLKAYRHVGMEIPPSSAEAWYTHILWQFLGSAMFCPRHLRYHPGEVHSNASGHRRNKTRTRDGRQCIGHKADGLVLTKPSRFELCAIETANKDNGQNATKTLDDIRKLAKMTKDMHDIIRESSTTSIRNHLLTFGVRISALSASFYTMRQREGRFYQMCTESSGSLPDEWNEVSTVAVLGVLERVLMFRKAMVEMSRHIPQWTFVSVGGNDPGAHGDCHAATLTSPHLIPDTDQSLVEMIPEITLP